MPLRPVAPARRVALKILFEVERQQGHSDELLRSAEVTAMSRVDRNFATALVMGVLRWQIALDGDLLPLLSRPAERPPLPVLLALRMGAFQVQHMGRIPVHAAVHESVELCREAGQPQAAAMVNAVLRRVAARGREMSPGKVPIFESTEAFARRLGHPAWLVERWVAVYGRAAAMRICEAGQHEPGRGQMFRTAADREVRRAEEAAGGVSHDAQERDGWDPEDAESLGPAEAESRRFAMDDGSRLVAELAAAAMPEVRRVWDCCAAPGGKTMVLLQRLPEAELLATDVSARRLEAMRARLQRSGYVRSGLRTMPAAAESLPETEGSFDLVLCDVPCSGTGTLARNPEIRHRLRPEEFARQAERQRQILAAALARVAPGGRLVYATCSLEWEECEAVVDAAAKGWRRVPLQPLKERLEREGVVGEGSFADTMLRDDALRTLPGIDPCDGFFAVVLERPRS